MKHTISDEVLAQHGLTLPEYLLLLFNARGGDVRECIESLSHKGWGVKDLFDDTKLVLSDNTRTKVGFVLLDSDERVETKEQEFNDLADKLREIFPKGRKAGTTHSWRGSTMDVANKLKSLVVKYGCTFTEEEAIEATKAYVAAFNGDYKYMKVLKYFILKTPTVNGQVEVQSDLMSYIQNKDIGEEQNGNWAIDLA